MANVTMIPARKKVASSRAECSKLKVCAYCRVSTDSEEQATSYDTQVEHYTNYIKDHDEWEFVRIYADDGISGTNTKKRDDFNLMIEDCLNGKIDLILTKSISRFARNTLDCIKYIRQLKDKNVAVFFEKENINTSRITEYDEGLVRKLIERIVVHADGSIMVVFKSGTEVRSEI